MYSKDYLASGYTSDALYVSSANVQQLPLGTVKITEVKNSLGYMVIQSPLYCTIAEDSSKASGAKHIWTDESRAISPPFCSVMKLYYKSSLLSTNGQRNFCNDSLQSLEFLLFVLIKRVPFLLLSIYIVCKLWYK